jgi:hypothetical protein
MAEATGQEDGRRAGAPEPGGAPHGRPEQSISQTVVYLPPLWDCLRADLQQALRTLAPGRQGLEPPPSIHPRLAAAARLTYMLREQPQPELRSALLRALAAYALEQAWALQREGTYEGAAEYYLAYFHLLHEAPILDQGAPAQQHVALARFQTLAAARCGQPVPVMVNPEHTAVALAAKGSAEVQTAWLELMERLARASPSAVAALAARLWLLSIRDPRAQAAANVLTALVPALRQRPVPPPQSGAQKPRSTLEAAYAELTAALQGLEERVAAGRPAAWSHAEWLRLEEAQRSLAEQLTRVLSRSPRSAAQLPTDRNHNRT